MAKPLRPKRGTTAKNDAFTGLANEITLDTEKHSIRVHDGLTAGGVAEILPKAKNDELYEAKGVALPKTGGEMSGAIVSTNGEVIRGSHDYGNVTIRGGTAFKKGSQINAFGKDHPDKPGWLEIYASNEAVTKTAVFKPDGTFAWDGKNVITSAGGFMTGDITYSVGSITSNDNNTLKEFVVTADGDGKPGAFLSLHRTDCPDANGAFGLFTRNADGGLGPSLFARTDGSLLWNGKTVLTSDKDWAVSSNTNGWARHGTTGLTFQWGYIEVNGNAEVQISLPRTFSAVLTMYATYGWNNETSYTASGWSDGYKCFVRNNGAHMKPIYWFAIGFC
jgi:hypothetical protein